MYEIGTGFPYRPALPRPPPPVCVSFESVDLDSRDNTSNAKQ